MDSRGECSHVASALSITGTDHVGLPFHWLSDYTADLLAASLFTQEGVEEDVLADPVWGYGDLGSSRHHV